MIPSHSFVRRPIARPGHVRFLRDLGSVSVIRVAGGGLLFLTQILLAKWMGPESFGAYSFAFAWVVMLATLAGVGLTGTCVRFIAQYRATLDSSKILGLVRMTRVATALAGIVTAAGAIGFVSFFVPQSPFADPLLLALPAVPALALLNLDAAFARGFGWMALAPIAQQIVRPLLLLLIGAALVMWGGETSASAFILACVAAFGLAMVVQYLVVNRRIGAAVGNHRRQYETLIWLRVSGPLLLHAAAYMILTNIDLVLVGAYMQPGDVGVYTAAVRTATLVSFVYMVTSVVAQPTIAALHAQRRRQSLQSFVTLASRCSFLAAAGIGIVLIVSGRFVLEQFGAGFAAGYDALVILVSGHVAAAAMGPVTSILIMTGHQNTAAVIAGASIVTTVVLNVVLIPRFGIDGAAIATATNVVLSYGVMSVVARRQVHVSPTILGPRA